MHCSFTKSSSSFQGTAGLLAYQGPDEHLALLFSVPFSYALHRLQFALAVLKGRWPRTTWSGSSMASCRWRPQSPVW